MRHALVKSTGLDERLQRQLDCDAAPAYFVPQLVDVCSRYGNLADGRDALEAVLDAAKTYVNTSQRVACDQLIALLRVTRIPRQTRPPRRRMIPKLCAKPTSIICWKPAGR
jgi:hypothetical protein